MGNSNTKDIALDTDEKKKEYVERFFERTRNERVVNLKLFKFPVENPVEVVAEDGTKFATYKYPAVDGTQFKGVIFFIHGFQSYANRISHIASSLSELGYDFFSMDMRGHGKSGG